MNSSYSQDLSVQDGTGIPHLPGSDTNTFWMPDRSTPRPVLCQTWSAWASLLNAASVVDPTLIPFRYDLVNLGREALARLSSPLSVNFSNALYTAPISAALVTSTGLAYRTLLLDIDQLVATESAFLVGPWLEAARAWGANSSDCLIFNVQSSCPDFYEWNARVQITTWNPTPNNADAIPGGPNDYASKHWSGLISDYYAARALVAQNMGVAAAGQSWDDKAWKRAKAKLAYDWTTATNSYPTQVVGDALSISTAMHAKYAPYFSACA